MNLGASPAPRGWLAGPSLTLFTLLVFGALVFGAVELRSQQRADDVARTLTGGDPDRAPVWIRRYGCGGCHTIPGLGGADGQVAPPLDHLRQRVFIGGVRHTPDNLVRWIVAPQAFSPHAAMPATGIDEAQARDVAAYLYAH
ncbi:MAG TPA: cytochrome c [Burkholderiaceae bacterium]|nr:cytochrome c [Burkholderiaceae bacterium]